MRKLIASLFLKFGAWIDPRPLVIEEAQLPPTTPPQGYDIVRERVRDLNEVMHLLPREYYPWVNWDARPLRIVICLRADKHIVYAGD